ncbi:unnamed protein product [Adineta steineri]|uniref:DNA polymerase n=1 Tax=Adineta steineri TaxID=433720 RepID=A0A813NAD1_9BILA|nr:unnamed protein product [Adineta steineri]CAF4189463.1 unnamed protein product [Adineta steineri]
MATKRKVPDNPNSELIDFLNELGEYEKNVSRQIHKYNAYRKAAGSIAKVGHRIETIKDIKGLEGIGKKIEAKIEQYLSTGKIKKLETNRGDETGAAINQMTRVMGIGPAHANKLVHQEKIKTIEELRAHPKRDQLLTKTQQLGLKYLEEFEQKIPRDEMKQMETILVREITAIDDQLKAEIVGSYRRGAKASSDIDVLVTHSSATKLPSLLHKIVDILTKKVQFVTDTISIGESKFMGVCQLDSSKLHRRIDIRVFPNEQYHCALLYFTGNDQLNRHMRIVAQEQGYKLNEYSIQKVGSTGVLSKPLPVTSEQDIFDYLQMDYKEPNQRNM